MVILARLALTEGDEDVFVFDVVRPQLEVFLDDDVLPHLSQLLVAEVRDGDVHVGRLLPKHTQLDNLIIFEDHFLAQRNQQLTRPS